MSPSDFPISISQLLIILNFSSQQISLITMSYQPQLPQEIVKLANKQSSLRYSLQSDFDKSDTLSFSTDGPEIQFVFDCQETNNDGFLYENVPPVSFSKNRRKQMFAKYKQSQQQSIDIQNNDFQKSFDEIFQIKNIPSDRAQVENSPASDNKESEVKQEDKTVKDKEQLDEQYTKQEVMEEQLKIPKQSLDTQISQTEQKNEEKQKQQIKEICSKKKPNLKVCFNYISPTTPKISQQTLSASRKPSQKKTQGQQNKQYKVQQLQNQQEEVQITEQMQQLDPTQFITDANDANNKINQPIFQEEERIAIFLRKIHKLNSIIPNFWHPMINYETQKQYIQIIANNMEKAIVLVQKIADKVFFFLKVPKMFPNQMMKVEYFKKSGWEKKLEVPQIEDIKPKLNIKVGAINEQKLFEALKNYKQVALYYKNYISKDLDRPEGQKNYMRVRQKFWKLERNIRSISEDVYRASLMIGYPRFFNEYLSVLKSPHPTHKDKRLAQKHKIILATLIQNIQKKDPLSCSEVGFAVKMKLQKQLKFLHPF